MVDRSVDLKDLVKKFIPNSIGTQIEQACQSIYPLKDVYIRKVKTLTAPKFAITKLMEVCRTSFPCGKRLLLFREFMGLRGALCWRNFVSCQVSCNLHRVCRILTRLSLWQVHGNVQDSTAAAPVADEGTKVDRPTDA